jgi:hypothetical protein
VRNPPVFVSILGFFTLLAGFFWLYVGLRILGFDWFGLLGDLPKFNQTGLWGWLALLAGVVWILVAFGLWTLQEWAWVVAVVVAGFSLFEAFLWFIEYPGSGIGLSASILPLLIIWYLNSREIKAQFGRGPSENS